MQRNFSIYLDVIRFVAAVAVFLDHFVSKPFTDNVIHHDFGSYGVIAVTVFFILSGYVIGYVTEQRERTAAQYATARISRLYSVIIVALPLTLLLDALGAYLNPDFYSIRKVLWEPPSIPGYLSSFFLVNEFQVFGFGGIIAGSNAPFWSLSFEGTYYLIAGLVLFSKRIVWIPATIIIFLLAGKTIFATAPLWAAGFLLYRAKWNPDFGFKISLAGFVATIFGLIAVPYICHHLPSDNLGHLFPYGRGAFNRNLLQDYMAAVVFIPHLLFAQSLLKGMPDVKAPVANIIRQLGAMTFPMYLLHFPILAFVSAVSPLSHGGRLHGILLVVVTFSAVAIMTPVCDNLKGSIKSFIKTMMERPRIPVR